jgi:hypothetical protein
LSARKDLLKPGLEEEKKVEEQREIDDQGQKSERRCKKVMK